MNFKDLSQIQLTTFQNLLGRAPSSFDYALKDPYPTPRIEVTSATERAVELAFDQKDDSGKMNPADDYYNVQIKFTKRDHPFQSGKSVLTYEIGGSCPKSGILAVKGIENTNCKTSIAELKTWIDDRIQADQQQFKNFIKSIWPEASDLLVASAEDFASNNIPKYESDHPFPWKATLGATGTFIFISGLVYAYSRWSERKAAIERGDQQFSIGKNPPKGNGHIKIDDTSDSKIPILDRQIDVSFFSGRHSIRPLKNQYGAITEIIRQDVRTILTNNHTYELKAGDIVILSERLFYKYEGPLDGSNKSFTLVQSLLPEETLTQWKARLEQEIKDLRDALPLLKGQSDRKNRKRDMARIHRVLKAVDVELTEAKRRLKKKPPTNYEKKMGASRIIIDETLQAVRTKLLQKKLYENRVLQFEIDKAIYYQLFDEYDQSINGPDKESKAKALETKYNNLVADDAKLTQSFAEVSTAPLNFKRTPRATYSDRNLETLKPNQTIAVIDENSSTSVRTGEYHLFAPGIGEVSGFTGVGSSKHNVPKNEDAFGISLGLDGSLTAIVADGVGSSGHGDVASAQAVTLIAEQARNPQLNLGDIFLGADRKINQNASGGKTVATALRLTPTGKRELATIGDTQLWVGIPRAKEQLQFFRAFLPGNVSGISRAQGQLVTSASMNAAEGLVFAALGEGNKTITSELMGNKVPNDIYHADLNSVLSPEGTGSFPFISTKGVVFLLMSDGVANLFTREQMSSTVSGLTSASQMMQAIQQETQERLRLRELSAGLGTDQRRVIEEGSLQGFYIDAKGDIYDQPQNGNLIGTVKPDNITAVVIRLADSAPSQSVTPDASTDPKKPVIFDGVTKLYTYKRCQELLAELTTRIAKLESKKKRTEGEQKELNRMIEGRIALQKTYDEFEAEKSEQKNS